MASTATLAQGTLLQVSTTTGSAKTISAVAVGNPTILTSAGHGLSNGDVVTLAGFTGADAALLNGLQVSLTNVTTNSVAVQIDTTGKTITTGSATATPLQWATVGNLRTFSGADGKPAEIDVTNLSSTAKETITGLIDYGSFQFECDQLNSDAGQLRIFNAFTASISRIYKITLPNSNTATFTAFVTQFTTSGGVDQTVKRSIGLRITGSIAWA